MSCNCNKKLVVKEKEYYIPDIETGQKFRVTKEQYDSFMELWSSLRQMVKDPNFGKPVVVGTTGDLNVETEYSQFFYEATSRSNT